MREREKKNEKNEAMKRREALFILVAAFLLLLTCCCPSRLSCVEIPCYISLVLFHWVLLVVVHEVHLIAQLKCPR